MDAKANVEALKKHFNKAFSNGRTQTAQEFQDKRTVTDTREKYAPMKNIVVTTEGVEKLLSNLNLTWALGTDMITQSPQGTLQGNSSDPYHRQQSLNTGDVPADWSEAVLTPVYKTGEHYDSANDCPLSLTSIPCNVLVHIIVNGMMGHLETSKILSDSQHRFIKFRSCKTQLFGYLRYGVPQGCLLYTSDAADDC